MSAGLSGHMLQQPGRFALQACCLGERFELSFDVTHWLEGHFGNSLRGQSVETTGKFSSVTGQRRNAEGIASNHLLINGV